MISIIMLTLDRVDITKKVITHNLKGLVSGKDYDLFICDQGSKDALFVNWLSSLNPKYLRANKYNEGVARSLNQLILRTSGDVFFMPNDVTLSSNWYLKIKGHRHIEKAGIIGFEGQDLVLPQAEVDGLKIHTHPDPFVWEGAQIFGACLYTRELINCIGAFCEEYHPYGLEDSDYNFRAKINGFKNFYIPGTSFEHLGADNEGNPPAYKYSKEYSYFANVGLHRWRACNYHRIGTYIPFPVERPPLI